VVNIPLILKEANYKAMATVILPPPLEDGWEKVSDFSDFLKDWEKLDLSLNEVSSIFTV
jgi:hypothetical protein